MRVLSALSVLGLARGEESAGAGLPCPSCLPGAPPYPLTQPCELAPLKGTKACDHGAPLVSLSTCRSFGHLGRPEPFSFYVAQEERVEDIAGRVPLAELPNLFSDVTSGVPSLNIPQYNWWSEGPCTLRAAPCACLLVMKMTWVTRVLWLHVWAAALHGVSRCAYDRTRAPPDHSHGGCCWKGKCPTSFPAAITTSCSFNKTLFKAIGTAAGTEARVMSNVGQASLTFW